MAIDWRRVEQLYAAAVERPEADRRAFVEQSCSDDPVVRAEVESLLAAGAKAADFLEGRPTAAAEDFLDDATWTGRTIGPYRLERVLGSGGMGIVYLADRDDAEFRRHVAIKLIKAGGGTAEVIRRFRQERQILASLDHPNIARLFEGGVTDEGLPYYVMEYVEGEPITKYCDRKCLSINDRLRLFIDAALAVESAHRKLVVHRDIKPGNILVTDAGAVKLLDFGIAKALTPEAGDENPTLTATAMPLMTPAYASPEQIRNEMISVATDVYSLGVVLYELLSGYAPYDVRDRTPAEIAQAICTQAPEKLTAAVTKRDRKTGQPAMGEVSRARGTTPERLVKELRGDLENIVARALAKESERRYSSVGQFADDIARYLEGRPVIARPDTLAYRSKKFVRRHRAGVTAAVLAGLAIVGGTIAAAWEATVARRERAIAERRFDDVHKLANTFIFEFDDAIKNVQGTTAARALVVRRALEYLNRLSSEQSNNAELQRDLATAYQRVSDIQGYLHGPNLGDQKGALDSARRALAIREKLTAAHPNDVHMLQDLANSYDRVSELMWVAEDPKGAEAMSAKHIAVMESLNNQKAVDPVELAKAYNQRGWMLMVTKGDEKGLGEFARKAVIILEPIVTSSPQKADAREALSRAYEMLAGSLGDSRDKWPEIVATYKKSLDAVLPLVRADPRNPVYIKEVAGSYANLGHAYLGTEQPQLALPCNLEALRMVEAMAAADPNNHDTARSVGIASNAVGAALVQLGRAREAIPYIKKALAEFDSIPDQTSVIVVFMKAYAQYQLASAYQLAGDHDRARMLLQASVPVLTDLKKRGVTQGEEAQLADKAIALEAQVMHVVSR